MTALLLTGCSSTTSSESTGEYVDNTAITTKIKSKLTAQLGTEGLNIKVKSYKGQVQLSGFVKDSEVKQKATNIAMNVNGVEIVHNNLMVKN